MPTYAFDPSRLSDSQKLALQQKYPSSTNIYSSQSYLRPPGNVPFGGQSPLTPEEEEEQGLEERAAQYQKGVAEFNLGQKEAELEKRRAGAEEIASGKFMLGGKAVSREGMNQYQQKSEQAAARVRADNPVDPFYMRARQYIAQNEPPPRPQMPGESQEQYSARVQRYAGQQQNRARRTNQVYNQMKENALIRSIQQFRDDPSGYLMGGGMSGQRTKTIAPDELMNYLGKANQMFQLTGGEGNFMDYLLGGKSITRLSKFTDPRYRDNREYQIRDLAKRNGEDPAVTQASIDQMNAEKSNRQLDLDYITMQKDRATRTQSPREIALRRLEENARNMLIQRQNEMQNKA